MEVSKNSKMPMLESVQIMICILTKNELHSQLTFTCPKSTIKIQGVKYVQR